MAASGARRGRICDELGVAPSTAWRWVKQHRDLGDAAIDKSMGRPPRLSAEQVRQVVDGLVLGPEAHGCETPLWTLGRIADMIRRTTGVSCNANYIAVFMHRLGWSCQKPERRAKERDEEAIAGWVRNTWPAIKKKPQS
jgi:transposase